MRLRCCLPFLMLPAIVFAQDDGLRERIQDKHAEGSDLWIYNDIGAATTRAKKEDKPLFVTFRCVPCEDCEAFDAEVASGSDVIRKFASENFVSVRQVEMKGVNLSQFQFDYDLNWAAMFINVDGTVYARYGTQSAEGADAFNSIEGLKATMERVLALHRDYPNNRKQLAGKLGAKKSYKSAIEMPGLPENKNRFLGTTSRKNCIHCHMIHDAENEYLQTSGKMTHDRLWRYPLPTNIGITTDPDHGLKITELTGEAKASGLKVGENLTHLNGQVLASVADIQWVLHGLKNQSETITATGSKSGEHQLNISPGWKQTDISWRGSLWSVSPQVNVWMPKVRDAQRKRAGLAADVPALEVRWINRGKAGGKAAFDAGLRQGDVVVKAGGEPVDAEPARFQMNLKLRYKVGDELELTVLRKGREKTISVPLVK